ncbi:TPA: hypothetical protein JBD37_15545 [Legionella pneumophila subsp. pneumophila]|uniref:hypothetical protein n=1 Tax=Legionella pneumophila TaxID=446 RepID=UPI000152762E|nr:hypothetical protein [Legionella pneumophila]ABQ54193.1 hypothetical protein LPC_0195 [Legionella pneumophila str. Corby]AOW58439.1 hypothetical protein BE843_09335 [Legionella pneumophila subsp. pneumophila]AOW61377.1 hypothetical protein BE844_09430 [Legionella pneumophila subsp. pneumophila]AOW66775.1 hypothetical protein BE846_07200 [Legionella pneumophila subsp. pneumophila]MCK0182169.1 hypothetical protein [Legionella pneumophila]
MEEKKFTGRFLRFVYQQIVLRFIGQVREPYLVRIDRIFTHPDTNELSVAFHIANKRVNQVQSVADFVKSDMIYLIDPRIVFDIGQQFGAHSEKLTILEKKQPDLKTKCIAGLKRVFIDE